ncbi:inositol monophosphatase family protein [Pseudomonas aeruginosa]|uniref:inositol monophosphatase family protein n=2 Tax=Pseudomonas aeruginosa TaxID=287 RepID=UPI001260C693|nr:inositol monophosphatase family protein [Pseudomonas aeruginosa]
MRERSDPSSSVLLVRPVDRALLDAVTALVLEAGHRIVAELLRPGGPRGAGDKAEIDVEVEVMLRQGLTRLLACDFVGEETGVLLTGHRYCWVVDPNDGTRDFLQGHPGSAISVGLLDDCVPVLGVVYAPRTDRGPDCIAWSRGLSSLLRNGALTAPNASAGGLKEGGQVFVSLAARARPIENAALCAPATFHPMPSIAYRLARVAAGDGIAAVSLYAVSPHDVVAGHALLRACGGGLWNEQGQAVGYATPTAFNQPVRFCFGGTEAACRELVARPWQLALRACD